jgi:hypothetical protein
MKKNFTFLTLCMAFLSTTSLLAQVPIFTDAYATGVTFAAFGGSVNDVSVDNTVNQSGTSSLKVVVPAMGYTGGALVAATPQNLSTYNAVSFWIKGSAAKKLNVGGLGNNAATTVYQTELADIPVTTTWTKFIIPIPVPSKLAAETGLFHFAEGSDEGAYTIWLDNIQYENLAATVVGTPTATIATETVTKGIGDAFEASGLSCTFPINAVATKLSVTKAYFTFASANTAVATVSALGVGSCVSVGTSAITAKLGAVAATGTLTVNVIAGTTPTTAAPTPTRLAANVISLYSKPYTNVAGINWFPNWAQTTVVSDVLIAGDSTKKYVSMNYQGVDFATPINVTTMSNLHIDMWTPNITSFKVFLINVGTPTVEQAVTLTPTLSGWNSFDIPLASYNTIKLATINQIKLESVPFGSGTAYLDNIYFYKFGTATNDVTFAKNLFTVTPSVSDASVQLNLTENVKGSTQITLSNLAGQTVYNQIVAANGTSLTQEISTKNLPAGMYVIGVRVGSVLQNEKIVVTH